MAWKYPDYLDVLREAAGDRLWETTPRRHDFVLESGTGVAVYYDRPFTLSVKDTVSALDLGIFAFGLFVAPTRQRAEESTIDVTGQIDGG